MSARRTNAVSPEKSHAPAFVASTRHSTANAAAAHTASARRRQRKPVFADAQQLRPSLS